MVDKLDYEELRKCQRREKNTAKLLELKDNFYEELKQLIKEKESHYKQKMDYEAKNSLDNIRKIAKDLYKRRERKIMTRALKEAEQAKKYNLAGKEKQLFQKIREVIEDERKSLQEILEGIEETMEEANKQTEETDKQTEETEDEEEVEKTEEKKEDTHDQDLNKVMVKILKEVPSFVSQNLEKLGPYQPDTKVKLPEKQARMLSEKGLAEKVKKDEDT